MWPSGRRLLSVALVTLGGAALAWVFVPPARGPAPVPFAHSAHTRSGMACTVCHEGAASATRAQLPAAEVCVRCHAGPPPRVEDATWQPVTTLEPIAWRRLSAVPDHVMFSHRRHVGIARLDCASCHRGIGRASARPGRLPVRLDMNACLTCHQRENVSTDCAACHR